jgi:CBS-domain-containing membrane protein
MNIFDEKFKTHKVKYVLQCALATCSVFVVLLLLDILHDTAIIAALGASSFIAFTMPGAQVSRPKFLIGGYLFGILAGTFCHYLSVWLPLAQWHVAAQEFSDVLFGALSVGLAIFLMVITDTEHPPAAGLALGFVLNDWNHFTVMVVVVGIVSLSILKTLLKPVLMDLL